MDIIRAKVSKKKKRFTQDGFNLDLTYITDRVIAMGCPSESIEAMYRNPINEVKRFFDTYHKDRYHIINLCSERAYNIKKFDGRVSSIPFDDHNCPSIEQIEEFSITVERWLNENPANICAVHCKAGKGRTGLMLCCWMLYIQMWTTSKEALGFYGFVRCEDEKGVTIKSQRRYVGYWEELTRAPKNKVAFTIKRITLNNSPFKGDNAVLIGVKVKTIDNNGVTTELYDNTSAEVVDLPTDNVGDFAQISLPNSLIISGDIKIELYQKKNTSSLRRGGTFTNTHLCHFWLHTSFIKKNELLLERDDLDSVDRRFSNDFSVHVLFEEAPKRPLGLIGERASQLYRNPSKRRSETMRFATQKVETARSTILFLFNTMEQTFSFLVDTVFKEDFLSSHDKKDIIKQIALFSKEIVEVLHDLPHFAVDYKSSLYNQHSSIIRESLQPYQQGSLNSLRMSASEQETFIIISLRKIIVKAFHESLCKMADVKHLANTLAKNTVSDSRSDLYEYEAGKMFALAVLMKRVKQALDTFQDKMATMNKKYRSSSDFSSSVISYCEEISLGTQRFSSIEYEDVIN